MSQGPIKAAIAFVTGRKEPRLEWVIDALEQQVQAGDDLTLIVIDAIAAWPAARRDVSELGYRPMPAIGRVIHIPPKPNPWQGPHRIIDREGWGMANARNTAFIACPPDVEYIAFLDDRARPGPSWLDAVRRGDRRRDAVLAGAYEKTESTDAEGGTTLVHDHRLKHHPGGLPNCGGGWLYGCTFAMPLAWALEVNGFEEGTDGLSLEDCIFGLMLGNRHHRIDYVPSLFVSQDRTIGNTSTKGGFYAARDKGISPNDKSHAALARFRKRNRTTPEFTADLAQLRERFHATGGDYHRTEWPLPDPNMVDWYDGQPIRDLFADLPLP